MYNVNRTGKQLKINSTIAAAKMKLLCTKNIYRNVE